MRFFFWREIWTAQEILDDLVKALRAAESCKYLLVEL